MDTAQRAAVWVAGHPRTKGSMTAQGTHRGRIRITDTEQSKQWRRAMTLALRQAVKTGRASYVIERPVLVRLAFYTPYPATHPWAGDLDKLERNALDAMTGSVISDDRYVVKIDSVKVHSAGTAHGPGVMIEVWEVPE